MAIMSIDNALVTQFSDMVHIEAQQMQSRLKPYVKYKPMTGDRWAFDRLGEAEDREVTGRNVPIVFDDVNHTRRLIPRRRYHIALPIDDFDKLGMLIEPGSEYVKLITMALLRRLDRVVAQAALAPVQTGRDFETTISAAADGVLPVDGTGGFTYEDLLQINKNFTDNEVGNDYPMKKALLMTGKEEEELMSEIELISGDFTRDYAVEKGGLVRGAGLDFIKFGANSQNPVLAVPSTRSCIAMAEGAVCVGVSKEIDIKIQERPDLVDTYQVVASYYLGAVRTEGKLVQQVNTTA
jgi:hypothetical protein